MFLAQENGGEGGGSLLFPLLMIVGLFAIFYFMLIRPQRRRREAQQNLQSSLSVGDEVVTIGGLYGTVVDLDDKTVILETYEGVFNRYARGAISEVVSQPDEEVDADTGTDTLTKPFESPDGSPEAFRPGPDGAETEATERRDGKD